MTKEEKIKEAWGKLMPDYTNIDLDNGWSLNDFYEEDFNDNDFYTMQIYTPCKIRPKSLQGIGDNNGWIRIESEDDLPKEEKDYWVVDSDGEVFICFFDTDYKAFSGYFHYDQKGKITHYQPIEKPLKPLY